MNKDSLIKLIKNTPEAIEFDQVMQVILQNYEYTPTTFSNGEDGDLVINEAGSNEGSCKIFAFALLNNLDREQTLACFGHFYREDVLAHPEGTDHANIRNFMRYGWDGIRFSAVALEEKKSQDSEQGVITD